MQDPQNKKLTKTEIEEDPNFRGGGVDSARQSVNMSDRF